MLTLLRAPIVIVEASLLDSEEQFAPMLKPSLRMVSQRNTLAPSWGHIMGSAYFLRGIKVNERCNKSLNVEGRDVGVRMTRRTELRLMHI